MLQRPPLYAGDSLLVITQIKLLIPIWKGMQVLKYPQNWTIGSAKVGGVGGQVVPELEGETFFSDGERKNENNLNQSTNKENQQVTCTLLSSTVMIL